MTRPATELGPQIRDVVLSALPSDHPVLELRRFVELVRDYPERRGKMLRGTIVVLSSRAHGGDEAAAFKAAAGVELFQDWVLVHDDIEDDSERRRGKPALHHLVGTPIAINVGDALHVLMWQLLMSLPAVSAVGVDREAILHEFLSMILNTAEGQHLDLSWVAEGRFDIGEEDYLAMVTRKTAYYTVVCPLRLGAACAGMTPSPLFERGGVDLGIAFQIRDDVLNLVPDASGGYGKEHAGDLYEGKRTLILAHLLAHADADEHARARDILARPRAGKTADDIAWLLAAIHRHGSLSYAQSVAQERARRGLAVVSEALSVLPGRAGAAAIQSLLGSVAERTR